MVSQPEESGDEGSQRSGNIDERAEPSVSNQPDDSSLNLEHEWKVLYGTVQRQCNKLLFTNSNSIDASDICQETCIRLLSFARRNKIGPFELNHKINLINLIIRRVIYDHAKRMNTSYEKILRSDEKLIDNRDMIAKSNYISDIYIKELLDSLHVEPESRTVADLLSKGFSFSEISIKMGNSLRTVGRIVHRIRLILIFSSKRSDKY